MYEIKQKFISLNRSGMPLMAAGAVIHETANPGDSAMMEFNYFNSGVRDASAHAFVDAGNIIQTVPWTERAWHAGPTANRLYWGIEMCHATDSGKFDAIWQRTIWLFAWLFKTQAFPRILKVTPENLPSHAELSNKFRETDHLDPVSYFKKFGKSVDMFRAEVQQYIDLMVFNDVVGNEKIIRSPGYWRENCWENRLVEGAYVQQLIKNYVAMFKLCNNFAECVDYLKSKGITNRPDYWINNAVEGGKCDGKFVRNLIVGMGRNLNI